MSDLHARFEKLARRGTPRGADAVLAAATRDADASGLAPVIDIQPLSTAAADTIEPVELEDEAPRRRRRLGSVIAAGGIAATLFVGVLAIGSFVGNGGGSDSPEGAVRQLAAAVSHSDPLAAADVLAPDEVRSLNGTITAAEKRAQELTLVNTASEPLAGLDLSVDNLNLSTQSLGNGYAKVTVDAGTISAHTDKPRLSALLQRALRDSRDNGSGNDSAHADLATLGRGADLPTFVVTVQQNGHWYVSAAYTVLEYIREANHLPEADFGSGVNAEATLGSATPDAAVTDMVHALSTGDWQKLISLAPPDEIPVYDYRAALLQLAADSHPNFTIGSIGTTATVTGDTAKVKLKASGTTSSGAKWSVDGSCFTGSDISVSGGFSSDGEIPTQTSVGPASTECGLGSIFLARGDTPSQGAASDDAVTTVREGGRWFMSPVGTVLDVVNEALAGIDQRDLYTLLDVPDLLPPDGALTLGKPVTLSKPTMVYTFSGHEGEKLFGLSEGWKTANDEFAFDSEARVYDAAGKQVASDGGLLHGEPVTLPADGTYKFVFETFSGRTDSTVTIWDAADAPAAAKHPEGLGGCTLNGTTETCSGAIPSAIVPGLPAQGTTATTSVPPSAGASTTTVPSG